MSPADCVKDNTTGGDGTRKVPFSMEPVHREIRELAAIFDVQDRGEALVADLKAREAAAIASVRGVGARDVPAVVRFSGKEVQGDPFVTGANGISAYLLQTLGVRNVITTDDEWPLTSWESIAADDTAVKLAILESDPVVGKLDAARSKRFILMDVEAMHASVRTVDGIEAIAGAIARFGLVS
ncbi:ABC transporter substrate-binding protein [Azospirillum halopraeferens]|uniref:ABC transporter substrate-binding protein n=1 Tax=Azospirillum halopraeferens TaxID=34010 RepID=UPI00040E7A5A|nr:ABC transporter substrate-binding protein [Azospirillum halopraeferens]